MCDKSCHHINHFSCYILFKFIIKHSRSSGCSLSHGHNPSYVQVLASACCLRVKTWENVGKMCGSARGEYGLSTDLGARRHAVEILVHAELSLRSGYGFTPSTDDAGTSTANVRTTYSLREFFTIFPIIGHGHLLYRRRT